ncbi:Hint domain-containing protein [Roseovarius sp. SCSIO 43702]|uniref:Hint domain-containing protein n=1 Tax=Roseovarius sp. SCSIO 43702 TaxID=2823043 RepID=UPI001C72B70D|nr:Hint domain-containing protein [Roseovarius sp. SCSIO 43702]QYX55235.1 Hint domain-containing protein [Roseovarius sp. SCSIO 43702]
MAIKLSNGLLFTEFLADNAGSNAFDTDGDGGANKADEFITIQSARGGPLDLDGIEIWSAKRGLLHDFAPGDALGPNGTATVVGQYDGTPPPGFFDAGLPDDNTNAGLLEDGEHGKNDTLYLLDTNTGEYLSFSYGDPLTVLPPPSGFGGTTNLGNESLSSDAPNGTAFRRDSNGDFRETTRPQPGQRAAPCFVSGTLIDTDHGPRPVETLRAGDLVLTRDAGAQPVRWAGGVRLDTATLLAAPHLHPFRIEAGALGRGLPARDLWLSPQHRVLVRSRIAGRMFGTPEVLIAVKKLAGCPGISQVALPGLSYHHLLLDAHHVLSAEQSPCESLYLGTEAAYVFDPDTLREIAALFPDLLSGSHRMPPARPLAEGRRARNLAARHLRNGRALLEPAA